MLEYKFNLKHNVSNLSELIDKLTLKNLIRNKSFVDIGRMFNVSDNAVRKWCKKYGLPYQKKKINSFTDQEWNKMFNN